MPAVKDYRPGGLRFDSNCFREASVQTAMESCLRDYALSSQAGAEEEEQVGRGVVWTSIPMIESRLPCVVKVERFHTMGWL